MATRGDESRRQREVEQQIQRAKQSEEASLLEFRRAAWVDREAVRAAQLQKDRELLASKLNSWRNEKDVEKQLELQEDMQRQKDLNARHEDWLDVEFYKSEMVRSQRESLVGRLDKWRVEKTLEVQQQQERAEAEEFDLLLRTQTQHDVETFRKEIEQNRRASLAGRLDKGRKDRQQEADQRLAQNLVEQQDHLLWLEDRAAVQQAQERERDRARQSLVQRHALDIQAQQQQKSEMIKAAEEAHIDFTQSEGEWRDQRKFQEVQRELRRRSIVANYMESQRQHRYDVQCHRLALDNLHEELAVKREEWLDEQAHKQEQEQRRRQSVCVRLDSWRQQRMAEDMLTMKKRLLAEEEAELQRLDFEAVQRARDLTKVAEQKAFSNTRLRL
jgi:hypothetical protein